MEQRGFRLSSRWLVRNSDSRPWWLMSFISVAQNIREERRWLRLLRDRLWREDYISRKYDELCPDEIPGDILGLRRLLDMEPFPGLVEHENWDKAWEFFSEWPLLMLFILGFYRRKPRTPKPPMRSHSF